MRDRYGLCLWILNGRLIEETYYEKRNDTDQPFKVNDVREDMDGRQQLPCKESYDTDKSRVKGCIFEA